jgi:glycosyltransferase involved in cell wall biosynthesis
LTDQTSTRPPLVSIIITNYNYGTFVGEAITSALDQTCPRLEVVVVDDGSTDDSREVIAGYGARLIPLLKENGGHASAVNAGFMASRGEIVMLLDADDYFLSPRAAERVVAAWEPDVVQVHCRTKMVDALGNLMAFGPPLELALDSGEVWRTLLEKGDYVSRFTQGLSFSRAVLDTRGRSQLLVSINENQRIVSQ